MTRGPHDMTPPPTVAHLEAVIAATPPGEYCGLTRTELVTLWRWHHDHDPPSTIDGATYRTQPLRVIPEDWRDHGRDQYLAWPAYADHTERLAELDAAIRQATSRRWRRVTLPVWL